MRIQESRCLRTIMLALMFLLLQWSGERAALGLPGKTEGGISALARSASEGRSCPRWRCGLVSKVP